MVPYRGVGESNYLRNLSFPVGFLDASPPDFQGGIYIGTCLNGKDNGSHDPRLRGSRDGKRSGKAKGKMKRKCGLVGMYRAAPEDDSGKFGNDTASNANGQL